MAQGESTTEVLSAAHNLDRTAFLKRYTRPAIIIAREFHSRPGRGSSPLETTRRPALQTLLEPRGDIEVVFLAPKKGSPFEDALTIGRSETCDVVLAHPTVSKEHALYVTLENGHAIQDAGSTNGTFIGTLRLAKGERRKLGASEAIAFGELQATFKEPAALFQFLASLR